MINTPNPLATLLQAMAFAADKHRNQRHKDADALPYINHPIALAHVLANEGGVLDVTVLCGRQDQQFARHPGLAPRRLVGRAQTGLLRMGRRRGCRPARRAPGAGGGV